MVQGIDTYNTAVTGQVSCTIGVNCGMSIGRGGLMIDSEPILLESNQNHATITKTGICNTLPAGMGDGGGYVPMIVLALENSSNGGMTDGSVSPILKCCSYKDPPMIVLRTGDIVCVDQGGGKSSVSIYREISPTLATTHYGAPAIAFEVIRNDNT